MMIRIRGPRIRHILTFPLSCESLPNNLDFKATGFVIVSEDEEVNPKGKKLSLNYSKSGTEYVKVILICGAEALSFSQCHIRLNRV